MLTIIPTPAFALSYKKLTPFVRKQADKQIHMLRVNPRHPSLHVKLMRGHPGVWRARINRDYRLLFEWEKDSITLLAICPHEK